VKKNVQDLMQLSDHIFARQKPMLSLYQTLAEHFYPERADFTFPRNVGSEMADGLVDSYPILVRRDLANNFSSMLRDGQWFKTSTTGEPDHMGKMWLDWQTKRQFDLMHSRSAGLIRATKEGDHDFATFGQCVISVELNRQRSGYLYRSWHLRDCAWWDDETGQVSGHSRKWKPTRQIAIDYFGKAGNLHRNTLHDIEHNAFTDMDVRHMVIPSNMYGDEEIESKYKWVSLFIDIENEHLIEEVGLNSRVYVVPRFQTIAGSPYAYSPATIAGLPNARCLQAITHTLLEASERYARPPLIATQKVIRSDVNLDSDGITWVDDAYDERMGAALRPITQDRGGFPIGDNMRSMVMETLASAFYIDKLSLPDKSNMTAYEVSEYMKQYRRQNLPLFAPMEIDYNGQLCEATFELGMAAGFYGSQYDVPESLLDKDVKFEFKSPLNSSEEEKRATQLQMTSQMLSEAAAIDPNVVLNANLDEAIRDAIVGIGAPQRWLRDVEFVTQSRKAIALRDAAMQAQQMQLGAPQ
jgi:hypothetical protein